jgi:uncharacterized membrane protein required for colicin V production
MNRLDRLAGLVAGLAVVALVLVVTLVAVAHMQQGLDAYLSHLGGRS